MSDLIMPGDASYEDLLARLRVDLQLDATTDVLPGSVFQALLNDVGPHGTINSAGKATLLSDLTTCAFRAYFSAGATTIAPGWQPWIADVVNYDLGSNYDAATGLFTAPVDGVYHFDMQLSLNLQNNPQEWVAGIWRSGYAAGAAPGPDGGFAGSSAFVRGGTAGDPWNMVASGPLKMSAGEQVWFGVYNSGGNNSFIMNIGYWNNWLAGHLIA